MSFAVFTTIKPVQFCARIRAYDDGFGGRESWRCTAELDPPFLPAQLPVRNAIPLAPGETSTTGSNALQVFGSGLVGWGRGVQQPEDKCDQKAGP